MKTLITQLFIVPKNHFALMSTILTVGEYNEAFRMDDLIIHENRCPMRDACRCEGQAEVIANSTLT